ncbi:MAG TPA: carboxylating nicotinate-nucleotide diphosphorylase [Syntrophomonas sp.]|jgi:nicotinate-nucleotide pyrophosphorylase (carboxylating)|nr:carboxylating nicotinate-nucleotide diphosphorylase [Syntrophomonas sp.]HRW12073.1 carboxylating nicotinate-nucleotide diphosphorylase [Syntrophomonas sp.]
MDYPGLNELISRSLAEDMGYGDITTMSVVPQEQSSEGFLIAKADGIIAGLGVARAVFAQLDPEADFTCFLEDGCPVSAGSIIAKVRGRSRALLSAERTALNFLQRLSGIATQTHYLTQLIKDYPAQLLDTRKTTPGLRILEKYAVAAGGGCNHRFGLYDGVMIKDNHIIAAGGIAQAVVMARAKVPHTLKIEVEVENLVQLQEALEAGADIIMLDNMPPAMMKEAVTLVAGRALLEASGGIKAANLAEIAQTGVDFISMGALTHSAVSLDISFDLHQL